ncbi:MAG: alpha/beta fold hydrolase [Ignavibacteriae bacterium]|nr:alpha/beta fold hydrolase [Ignavibacteria bacterium]MBI3364545.1 alpha/beta fold hydrolase [Ignavibacteriota bacterium]
MPPLLLLHGALGSKEQFDPLLQLLSDNLPVHSLNFTGHGSVPLTDEPFCIELFCTDVLEWMDREKIDCADIFGYSMGGCVGLFLARHHPTRVNRIMTLATKFQWDAITAQREAARLELKVIESKLPAFAQQLAQRHSEQNWRGVVERTAAMMLALGEKPTLTEQDLCSIQHTVLVSVGDRDTMVGIEETAAAYRSLPNAQLLILPGTPHPLERVEPKRLAREIKAFFSVD